MAIPDGKPATDFSAMNREWVRAVAAEAAAPGGGGGGSVLLITNNDRTLNKTGQEIATAFTGGSVCLVVTQTTQDDFIDTTYSPIIEYISSLSETEGNYYTFIIIDGSAGTSHVTTYACTDLSAYPAVPH